MRKINWPSRFKDFFPQAVAIDARERWRSAAGAVVGLLFTALISRLLGGGATYPLGLIAPLGASALLVFAVPASPMAQPWALVMGNGVSALIGVACARWMDDALLAGPIAVGLSIAAMFALRCLHPPGGAMALFAVLGHATAFTFVLFPALSGSILLVLAAMAYNTLTGRSYPHAPLARVASPVAGASGLAGRFSMADIDAVLANYNQVIDVSREDLETLLGQAQAVAYQRKLGDIRCADVMSPQVVTVQFGDSLEDAWALMRQHKVKALPVLDRVRRIAGIVTTSDFLRHANLDLHPGLAQRLRDFVRPSGKSTSDKPETVGQIMTRRVRVARADRHVVDLVPLFSEHGHHHIPVVDLENRLVGIITQSDLVRALFAGVKQNA